jgi:hypothetical protein
LPGSCHQVGQTFHAIAALLVALALGAAARKLAPLSAEGA